MGNDESKQSGPIFKMTRSTYCVECNMLTKHTTYTHTGVMLPNCVEGLLIWCEWCTRYTENITNSMISDKSDVFLNCQNCSEQNSRRQQMQWTAETASNKGRATTPNNARSEIIINTSRTNIIRNARTNESNRDNVYPDLNRELARMSTSDRPAQPFSRAHETRFSTSSVGRERDVVAPSSTRTTNEPGHQQIQQTAGTASNNVRATTPNNARSEIIINTSRTNIIRNAITNESNTDNVYPDFNREFARMSTSDKPVQPFSRAHETQFSTSNVGRERDVVAPSSSRTANDPGAASEQQKPTVWANNQQTTTKPSNYNYGVPSTSKAASGLVSPINSNTAPSAPPFQHFSSSPLNSIASSDISDEDDENENLKCPTCRHQFDGHIYQCPQGHSGCATCKNRGIPCAKCRLQFTNMRNFNVEEYMSEVRLACPNSCNGCKLKFRYCDMEDHKKKCLFGELICPVGELFGRCAWTGNLSQLGTHFINSYSEHFKAEVNKEMFLPDITRDNRYMYFVQMGNNNFLVHIKVSDVDQNLCMTVQLYGTMHCAAKWVYEIHIYKKDEPRRKFVYTARCHTARESLNIIFKVADCAAMPLSHAMTFCNDRKLFYKFYIKKMDDDPVRPKQRSNKKRYGRPNSNNSSK